MDELSAWAIRPWLTSAGACALTSRPVVGAGRRIDVEATVTRKGSSVGFVDCRITDADSKDVVGSGRIVYAVGKAPVAPRGAEQGTSGDSGSGGGEESSRDTHSRL